MKTKMVALIDRKPSNLCNPVEGDYWHKWGDSE